MKRHILHSKNSPEVRVQREQAEDWVELDRSADRPACRLARMWVLGAVPSLEEEEAGRYRMAYMQACRLVCRLVEAGEVVVR